MLTDALRLFHPQPLDRKLGRCLTEPSASSLCRMRQALPGRLLETKTRARDRIWPPACRWPRSGQPTHTGTKSASGNGGSRPPLDTRPATVTVQRRSWLPGGAGREGSQPFETNPFDDPGNDVEDQRSHQPSHPFLCVPPKARKPGPPTEKHAENQAIPRPLPHVTCFHARQREVGLLPARLPEPTTIGV